MKIVHELTLEEKILNIWNGQDLDWTGIDMVHTNLMGGELERLAQIQTMKKLIREHTNNILDDILSKGHGGGNWKRLIEQAKNR